MVGIVAAAKAGLGAALLPRGVADTAGGLVEIATVRPLMAAPLYLVSHQAHRSVARVQAVREFLRAQVEQLTSAAATARTARARTRPRAAKQSG
jgi:DNA-binding transcriptional LysR family regulator